ncbi:MAG: peptide chain release factor N(5)-glutamine methyltransferase [Armatimonadota bacterium]
MITAIARRLEGTGIERPRFEAELLVRAASGLSAEELIRDPDTELTDQQLRLADEWAARRAAREPLPYLVGKAEFYSRTFLVSPAAIVPRPETEILVEAAIERARAVGASTAADVGTGSGVLAVTLASEIAGLRAIATDISFEALRLASSNAELHEVSDRVFPVCCDLLAAVGQPVDCVVANLPYISRDDFAALEPEVRDYEPRIALDGGMDGLGMIGRLSVQVCDHLNKGGFAALEVGAGQAQEVAKLLTRGGLAKVEVLPDYAGAARVVIGWRRGR